jgi:hypothetical protein
VVDQVGNGADLQAMFGGKELQVGQARHGAVILHDLADHGAGGAARHGGQVAARFGVAGTNQHTAVRRLQREDMAGLNQVRGLGIACDGCLHRAGAVRCGNAGRDALCGFDRHREGGAVEGAIACRHRGQSQVFAALARQRQTDESAAKAGHEVDGFRGDMVGSEHQIALVLSVFFVDEDHHAAGPHLGDDVFHRRDGNGVREGHAVSLWGLKGTVPSMRST